jgi:NADH:ubiquinone oxidoreductase subunit D
MNEMSESLNICNQVIYKMQGSHTLNSTESEKNRNIISNKHEVLTYLNKNKNKNISSYSSMEEIIKHFKY